MADIDQIIAPPPGFTLRTIPEIPGLPAPPLDVDLLPPGFTIRGTQPPVQGLEELRRRDNINTELQKATGVLPDPQEEQAGIRNTYFYSHALDIPQAEAYQLRSEIAKELTDDGATQKTFWNRMTETVKTGAKSGHSGLQAGLI